MGFIYLISNDINNKKYVGQTKRSIEVRWKEHIRHAQSDPNMKILKAIKKYGAEHFFISELEKCDDNILNEREIYWIKYYDCINNGYNTSLETKVYSPYTNEDKQIILDLWAEGYGEIKISEQTGFNVETVRLHLNNNGISEQDIRNRQKETLSKKHSIPIIQCDLECNFIKEWESAKQAELIGGFNRRNITTVCKHKRKTSNGYKWFYKEEYENVWLH